MKILVIEDSPQNISSANMTLQGHDVTILKSITELLENLAYGTNFREFDLILTDMNIGVGEKKKYYSDTKNAKKEPTFAAGLVVLLKAIIEGVPCMIVTDANGHNCPLGALIEKYLGFEGEKSALAAGKYGEHGDSGTYPPLRLLAITRPEFVSDDPAKGKDWGKALEKAFWEFPSLRD